MRDNLVQKFQEKRILLNFRCMLEIPIDPIGTLGSLGVKKQTHLEDLSYEICVLANCATTPKPVTVTDLTPKKPMPFFLKKQSKTAIFKKWQKNLILMSILDF